MSALLEVTGVALSYDGIRALHDVSMRAERGTIVAIVGANGAGKSSLLRAISGLAPIERGSIVYDGRTIAGLPPHEIVRLGIAHVPEGRRIFATATVLDNLLLGAYTLADRNERSARLAAACAAFPILGERLAQRASTLSGGQQQMLAIARGTMSNPKLLMLDEPSLGLAPKLLPEIFAGVKRIAGEGTTVIIVEQNLRDALALADEAYVVQTGRVVLSGKASMVKDDPHVRVAYLGL